jgi:hypothetical protein
MAKESLGQVKINFFCDPTVLEAFRWLAASRSTSYSELMRVALREFALREIQVEQENIHVLSHVPADVSNG